MKISTRLVANIILIHALLMGFVVYDLIEKEKSFVLEQLDKKGVDFTTILASNASVALLNNDLIALDELINELYALHDHHMTFILDRFGKVKATSHKEFFNLYLDDTISSDLLAEMKSSKRPYIQLNHDGLTDTVTPIVTDGRVIGYARTLFDHSDVDANIRIMTQKGISYLIIAILLGALFAWLSVRRMTMHINLLSEAAKKIAQKSFDVTLPQSDSQDEISIMSRAFSVMKDSIETHLLKLSRSNQLLHHEKELAQTTLRSIGDAVIVTDKEARVTLINDAASALLGYTLEEVEGKVIDELFSLHEEHTLEPLEAPIYESLRSKSIIKLRENALLINRNKESFFIEDSSAPITNENEEVEGAVMVFHDVTAKRKEQEQLKWHALHDELTGLHNRASFNTMLEKLCKEILYDQKNHYLLFMDIDRFKIINDAVGHLAGDEALKKVAKILLSHVGNKDYLCRFGGDEFGLILINSTQEQAKKRALELIDAVLDFNYSYGDKHFKIGLSIGIAPINIHNNNPTAILSNADFACYKAKDSGRNRYYLFDLSEFELANQQHEIEWVNRIQRALKQQEFILYVQKIASLSGQADHYEVLIRLQESDGTIIPPDRFLNHAARYSLLNKIDLYVIETLFAWLHANKAHLDPMPKFAINITGQSLSEKSFTTDVLGLFKRYAIDPTKIIFEVTENTAINDIGDAQKFFSSLKKVGVEFALDDFGTGLSSFSYLKNIPVDYLKIDGVFIKEIEKDMIDRGMVESIQKISALMGMRTIAEYVENDTVTQIIKTIGIDYAQGYGIHRPESIERLLHS